MSDDSGFSMSIAPISVALLFIAFWGEPDLVDALIKYFMSSCGA